MKKLISCLILAGLFGGLVFADEIKAPLGQNPFSKEEKFPGDYFLIPSNLPHFMKVFRLQKENKAWNLSKEQIEKLQAAQEEVLSAVVPLAEKIKKLELEMADAVVYEGKNLKEVEVKLQEIANLRLEMTKKHVECINIFYKTLSKEQYKILLELVKQEQ